MCSLDFDEHATNATLQLEQNKAVYVGNSIFGALYETCYRAIKGKTCYNKVSFKEDISNFLVINWNNSNDVSSEPDKLCVCSNGKPTKKCHQTNVSAFSGQRFNISLAAVGQFESTAKVVVTATLCAPDDAICKPDYDDDLGLGESLQGLFLCNNISYTVNSIKKNVKIKVKVDHGSLASARDTIEISPFEIYVKLNPCPIGFILVNAISKLHSCDCIEYLKKRNIGCDKNLGRVVISGIEWVGFHPSHPKNITVHKSCPFDFCLSGAKKINLSIPDEQCNYNRSGVLCGACQSNFSMVLGTSNCKKCSNEYILLVIPFALAGVALVVLLLKCNLTVSVGHINGFILYANIVQVNKALLFPKQGTAYQIFSTFIAWLNLDLGIETCFFERMDSYVKVFLQFVFPVYLWTIICFIIVAAHYSSRMGRWIGSNSVPVLATLFLLSYAKLLRTVIAAVSFTFIGVHDGSYITVWLHDGNIEYFSLEHTPLFLTAIFFVVLYILPLTLLVLLAPCLQARSHHKAFKWVNRLKPFLDAYQGPYSNKFRYWTGLLLIVRMPLFLIYASNYENDPSMNFFWTVMILGPITMFCLIKRKVYRHKVANYIETFSLLNIVILGLVCWLTTTTGYNKWQPIREYATYSSVAMIMIVFLGIIFYQVGMKKIPKRKKSKRNNQEIDATQEVKSSQTIPTHSVVDLDQLNEPLLYTD